MNYLVYSTERKRSRRINESHPACAAAAFVGNRLRYGPTLRARYHNPDSVTYVYTCVVQPCSTITVYVGHLSGKERDR